MPYSEHQMPLEKRRGKSLEEEKGEAEEERNDSHNRGAACLVKRKKKY